MTRRPFLALLTLATLPLATPALRAQEATLAVGMPAPAPSIGHVLKGDPVEAFEAGRVYVVEFWATWCAPCIQNMPHLSELQERHAEDVTIVGVSDEPLATVQAWLETPANQEKTRYTLTTDPDRSMHTAYMQAAGRRGIPCAFIVDREGVVRFIGHPARMDEALAAVVEGREVPAAGDPAPGHGPVTGVSVQVGTARGRAATLGEAALLDVGAAHDPSAAAALEAMASALDAGPLALEFRAALTLPDAVQSPDGESADMEIVREGRLLRSPGHGTRLDATKHLGLPGLPPGVGEEHEIALLDAERILVKRTSRMAPEGWMALSRSDARALADEAPMPPPVRMMLDANPLYADPLSLLRTAVGAAALAPEEEGAEEGQLLLAGPCSPFLSMGHEGGPDSRGRLLLQLDATSHLPQRLVIQGPGMEQPTFVLVLAPTPWPDTPNAELFSIGDAQPGDLATAIREQGERMGALIDEGR